MPSYRFPKESRGFVQVLCRNLRLRFLGSLFICEFQPPQDLTMVPSEHEQGTVTRLLGQSAVGDADAKDKLFQLIYDDLRRAASRVLRRTNQNDFQTTDLVHQSMLRFQDEEVLERYSTNRKVFLSVAVRAMQRVMIDHHRRRVSKPPPVTNSEILDRAIRTTEQRFKFERQLLAKMQHENICRILDGGTLDDRRPYFVMEHRASGHA
ncbi:MAG: hypothetical protein KDB27_17755 [Planctomycetales bacterium]|nr:hypothetical protein [Planctomycetales bacterium]